MQADRESGWALCALIAKDENRVKYGVADVKSANGCSRGRRRRFDMATVASATPRSTVVPGVIDERELFARWHKEGEREAREAFRIIGWEGDVRQGPFFFAMRASASRNSSMLKGFRMYADTSCSIDAVAVSRLG